VPTPCQIASRLSATPDTTGFQSVVQGLLLRMAWDHPYHTLYPLYALKNGRKAPGVVQGSLRASCNLVLFAGAKAAAMDAAATPAATRPFRKPLLVMF
jgi:hypothetical protein